MQRFLRPFGLAAIVAGFLSLSGCVPVQEEPETPPVAQPRKPMARAVKPQVQQPMLRTESEYRLPPGIPVVKVALLLPLSGESQAVGSALLDAGMLALYDQYINLAPEKATVRVVLLPKDTGSSPGAAIEATKQAIAQGAQVIIGPLFSQSVAAIAPVAREARVPVIALSNNQAVAGGGVFVYGFSPEEQVARITSYAFTRGLTSYGLLTSNDAYGKTVSDALQKQVAEKGGKLSAIEKYAKTPANMEAAVARLSTLYAASPFKAPFIAESADQMKPLFPPLKSAGIDRASVQILGTGLWDDEAVLNYADLQGAWFASAQREPYAQFERRFYAAYNYKPKRIASLAYDSVTLVTSLLLAERGRVPSVAELTDPQGFQGPANGLYRMKSDGTTERVLAVMEVTPGGFKVLEPAPRGF